MPPAMSFSHTTDQILNRTKTVTRRLGWENLQPGDRFWAVKKAMGLKRGEFSALEQNMGRRKSLDVTEKRKPVHVRPIERKHAGKIQEPYRIMEELIPEHHDALKEATILLCWRKGWKPDVDKVLTLARIKKASDLDKALGSRFGDNYDFVMQLNEDNWSGLCDRDKRMVIDHELCHAAPDLDRDGNQKRDTKERLCWRCRKHPIQEFPEIVDRYGVDAALRRNEAALEAADRATMPLFANQKDEAAEPKSDNGKVAAKADPDAWQKKPISALVLSDKAADALEEAGIKTLGELSAAMIRGGEWWAKNNKIHGRFRQPIEEAINAYLSAEVPQKAGTAQDSDEADDPGAKEGDEFHPEAVRTLRVQLLRTITVDDLNLGMAGTVVEAFQDGDGEVFLAQKLEGRWVDGDLEAEDFSLVE